jgi:hypothetical protein
MDEIARVMNLHAGNHSKVEVAIVSNRTPTRTIDGSGIEAGQDWITDVHAV